MKIKTIYIRAERVEKFDRCVNEALEDGWVLEHKRLIQETVPGTVPMLYAELTKTDEEPAPDPEEKHRMILLEPDISYLVDIKRGTSTREDYVNTVLPHGMLVEEKFNGRVEAAINELFGISEQYEEETDDEQ